MSETIEAKDVVELQIEDQELPENMLQFTAGRPGSDGPVEVFTITAEGIFRLGDGITNQEAAQEFVAYVNRSLEATKDERIRSLEMRNARLAEEAQRLRRILDEEPDEHRVG